MITGGGGGWVGQRLQQKIRNLVKNTEGGGWLTDYKTVILVGLHAGRTEKSVTDNKLIQKITQLLRGLGE